METEVSRTEKEPDRKRAGQKKSRTEKEPDRKRAGQKKNVEKTISPETIIGQDFLHAFIYVLTIKDGKGRCLIYGKIKRACKRITKE